MFQMHAVNIAFISIYYCTLWDKYKYRAKIYVNLTNRTLH